LGLKKTKTKKERGTQKGGGEGRGEGGAV